MIKDKFLSGNHRSATLGKVLRLLEELKQTPTGKIIYEHVEHMLEDYEDDRNTIENAYAGLLNILLETYAGQVGDDPNLLAQIRSTQLRLNPPLSLSEFFVLQNFLKQLADQPPLITSSRESFQRAFTPLLESFGFTEQRAVTPTVAHEEATPAEGMPSKVIDIDTRGAIEQEQGIQPQAEFRVETAYQYQLKKKREEFQQVHDKFTKQVKKAIHQNEAFTRMLNNELEALNKAGSIEDLEHKRKAMVNELETLLTDYRVLTTEFDSINGILNEIESGSRELNEELSRVRLLSLTDELTNLPNRRAFLKRVDEELGRAKRYNTPLALAIIDLDEFKSINDAHGHRVGDMILKIYARDVVSIFRHHDMVARYGGEEFAVILPNTTLDDGLCALRKVQNRASRIVWKLGDQRFPLPSFSAGLAQHIAGESASEFIHRADTVMYRAKSSGRNCIELAAAPPQTEAGEIHSTSHSHQR